MTAANEQSPRVALVTGASSGIGEACARRLAAGGWRVFGTQRGPQLPPAGAVEMISMNVDDDESVTRGVAAVLERAGRVDALVNNAGFALAGAVEDTSTAEAKAQFETNFFGALRVVRAVLPAMRRQRSGTIVNISSLAGVFGLPFAGLYSASKFALEGLSESLRFETRGFGIRVVLVEPGDFRTRITERRRYAAAAEVNDAYRTLFEQFKKRQDEDETKAAAPEPVARVVERILRHPRPKLRYPVGIPSQRMVVPLRRFLPQWAFEWLACRLMGL
jgi:NAD(P)-dependent dehydrogenase (short-subunit alcohol dehydrogenase family)